MSPFPTGLTGGAFERLVKWWLTADPVYAAQVRRVWLWDEWPGRWGPDCGIDLVAEAKDGALWAIQTKAYDADASVTKAGVDSFLSESSRADFSFRLLVATTDRIAANALRAINGQEKPVGIVRRSDLEASAVVWPRSPHRLFAAGPRKPRRPRRHQAKAIHDVIGGFQSHARGQMIMACGTGKTLTGLWIAERLAAKRTLVLLPSLALLEQTLREWLANASEPFPFLAVCSDETVAPDEPMTRAYDLGVPVTTDAQRIHGFLRGRGRRVLFSTYQSSPVVAAAQEMGRAPGFDLAVADEAHRCTGPVGSEFTTVLDSERIRARRRLFMTATPRYFTGRIRREASEADLEIASMDDESTFGPVLHNLDFAQAIDKDLLCDYRVLVSAVDRPTYARMAAQAELVRGEGIGDTDARTLARQVTVLKAMRRYRLRRVLTFHGRVAGARRFALELPHVREWMPSQRPGGRLWASWVSGEMNVADRQVRLNHLRNVAVGERAVLSNARCLAEGVDVPTIDGVAFIDPRRSAIDVIQAVGRAIRVSKEKRLGTVVIPVVVEPDEDPEAVLAGSEFRHVWDVVNALRAHDTALGDELDELRRRLGRERVTGDRPGKLIVDLPAELGPGFAVAFDTRLVEQTTASWEFWLGLLQRFVAREGHARPSAQHIEEGHRLGSWVVVQRAARRHGSLGRKREQLLSALPGWVWNARDAVWEDEFCVLQATLDSSRTSSTGDDNQGPARHWVRRQRSLRKQGRLSRDRERRLTALRGWTWDPFDAQWEEGLAAVRAYVDVHGHARPPFSEPIVGPWVANKRFLMSQNRLTREQANVLKELPGWAWSAQDARWEEKFDALEAFVKRYGRALVTTESVDEGGRRIGRWLHKQRQESRRGRLHEQRARRLRDLLGPAWDTRQVSGGRRSRA